jgi:hypothetical protein
LTLNPILKVLSTFNKHNVKSLLIGGQACIIYGAAEFSRDSDFVALCEPENLKHLQKALSVLKAELIYVPPLEEEYLQRGHACHFRCNARDVKNLRIDVMSQLRGCDPFDILWRRRNTVSLKNKLVIQIIGLEDLVRSKKTQRDKDWYMLKRLVENDILTHKSNAGVKKVRWWLEECRSPGLMMELTQKYPVIAKESLMQRPLISSAIDSDLPKLELNLYEEELAERQKDIEYWAPLKKELEELRHNFRRENI